jgi:hypothetical protein
MPVSLAKTMLPRTPNQRRFKMNKLYVYAGIAASVIMIAIGIGAIVIGASGRSDVRDKVEIEGITGTPDMNPDDTRAAVEEAGIDVEIPDCSVAGKPVDDGESAKCFAEYMRIHALEDTDGKTYAEMPRFLGEDGKPVADEADAAIDPKSGAPVSNPERNIWVTETALSTALNTSYFAEKVSEFSIVMGLCLLLAGIGFLVLTLRLPWRNGQES